MKEKILAGLQAAMAASNEKITLSDRTIDDYVENIATLVTDEAQLTEQFYTAHLGILKSINGGVNHEIAVQVEEAKKNLTPPAPAPTPTPTPTPTSTPSPTPAPETKPQWAVELEAKMAAFEESRKAAEKQTEREKLIATVRKKASEKDPADEKSGWAGNKGVLNTVLEMLRIDDADTLETLEKKCREKYNAKCVEIFGSLDAVPGTGDDKKDEGTEWIAAEKKRLQKAGRLPKD